MAAEITIARYTFTGICIGLVVSLLAHLYLFFTSDGDRPDVPLPVGDSGLISDGKTVPVAPELRQFLEAGRYVALALVNEDGNLKLATIDGTVKEPCLLNGQIIGIGACEPDSGISNESDHGNETVVPAPEAALLLYATSSSATFCRTVDGVREHNTIDNSSGAPNWDVGDRPCRSAEATATTQLHNHN
ncbi:MAG: hypothetical protein ACT4QB_18735 [Gammaproteobacteria bacterium]